MVTEELIDAQLNLERYAVTEGLIRLHENTKALEAKNYSSASVYGVSSINAALPLVTQIIKDTTLDRISKGHNGVMFAEIHSHLATIEPEVIAAIGLKVTFDCVFGIRDSRRQVQEVCGSIGSALEDECQIRFYEERDPELLGRIKKFYWHSSCGTRQKKAVAQVLFNREEKRWIRWKRTTMVRLGAWVLDCIVNATGWFQKDILHLSKTRKIIKILPTVEFLAVKEDLIRQAELFSPVLLPMLIPPQSWVSETSGGYLTSEVMTGHKLVRSRGDKSGVWGEALGFINQLQQTAYRLNPLVVEVAEYLFERARPVGKFVPQFEFPLPAKPPDIATNEEARKSYCREAAQTMNQNAQMFKRSCRTRIAMNVVAKFKETDRFYLPWSFDYRGRAYPIPAFLTPQDTDFGKSLLRFAEESEMTSDAKWWLAFHLATAYGLDKAKLEDRVSWTYDNLELIEAVATDPIGNLSVWESAAEPWVFLAACGEFTACVIRCTRQTTGLPVAVDATCSGLQILAGLARDGSTARLVNVVASDSPQDAYLAVAEKAKEKLDPLCASFLDRKVTKRTVMTIPYNAKTHSSRMYIRDALREKGLEFTTQQLNDITAAIVASMREIVPGPLRVMDWVNREVAEAFKRGVTSLTWTTPSGFEVRQDLRKSKTVRVQLRLLGTCNMQVSEGCTDEIDLTRHKAATAPNLIHSLDASLLHLTFPKFSGPFTVIHDSVWCRATEMQQLNTLLRETYREIFSQDVLQRFAEQIGATSPPPIIGDFDPASVIDSPYFFC